LVLAPGIVGQSQVILDRRDKGTSPTRWTYEKIQNKLTERADSLLKTRLIEVAQWAKENGLFQEVNGKLMGFSIMTIWFAGDGTGYVGLASKHFGGDTERRNRFAAALKGISLLDPHLDVDSVKDGRGFFRRIDELSDEDLAELFKAIEDVSSANA
jgi:hypothetical protein